MMCCSGVIGRNFFLRYVRLDCNVKWNTIFILSVPGETGDDANYHSSNYHLRLDFGGYFAFQETYFNSF